MPQVLAAVAERVRRMVRAGQEERDVTLAGVLLFGVGGDDLGSNVIVGAVAVERGFQVLK